MTDKPNEPEPWTEFRFDQLQSLQRLLVECEQIDSASGVIERLKYIVDRAKHLGRCDHERRRISFMQFLEDHAIYGTSKPAEREVSK